MNIGTVVEGPTDRLVLKAILERLCPGENRFFDLQPAGASEIEMRGKGWKGVRRWCWETWKRQGASLQRILSEDSGAPLDLLVIQVDADIVSEHDLQEGNEAPIQDLNQPCPPIAGTTLRLKSVLIAWLHVTGANLLPRQVVFAIPSQDMENWTFAALFPQDDLCQRPDYECIHTSSNHPNYPAYRLTLKRYGKLLERDGSEIKKHVSRYRTAAAQVAQEWDGVCRICSQAEAFNQAVLERTGNQA
jgi:hypothetical protein